MRWLWLLPLLLFHFPLLAQPGKRSTTVVFYNVENLFDTKVDKGKSDFEFSPGSAKHWDQKKYSKKINDISRVLASVDPGSMPGIIGLCEVENRKVLEDMTLRDGLNRGNYSIVHKESNDRRGIDLALLYRRDLFRELSSKKIPIGKTPKSRASSREMLYTKLLSSPTDTLHIFVCHWHSRSEGEKATEPKRLLAAQTLRFQVDSLFDRNLKSKILIMGNMNDEPASASVNSYLQAGNPQKKIVTGQLYNLLYENDLKGEGTVSYKGKLLMFDNLIVSGTLLNDSKGWTTSPNTAKVFRAPWMEYRNGKNQVSPNRTYVGNKYAGGVSDHFPVCLVLRRN